MPHPYNPLTAFTRWLFDGARRVPAGSVHVAVRAAMNTAVRDAEADPLVPRDVLAEAVCVSVVEILARIGPSGGPRQWLAMALLGVTGGEDAAIATLQHVVAIMSAEPSATPTRAKVTLRGITGGESSQHACAVTAAEVGPDVRPSHPCRFSGSSATASSR